MTQVPVFGLRYNHHRQSGNPEQVGQVYDHNPGRNEPQFAFPKSRINSHQQRELKDLLKPGAALVNGYVPAVAEIEDPCLVYRRKIDAEHIFHNPKALIVHHVSHSLVHGNHQLPDRSKLQLDGPVPVKVVDEKRDEDEQRNICQRIQVMLSNEFSCRAPMAVNSCSGNHN